MQMQMCLQCNFFLFEAVLNTKGHLPRSDGGKGGGCLKANLLSQPHYLGGFRWSSYILRVPPTILGYRVIHCRKHRVISDLCCRMGMGHGFWHEIDLLYEWPSWKKRDHSLNLASLRLSNFISLRQKTKAQRGEWLTQGSTVNSI